MSINIIKKEELFGRLNEISEENGFVLLEQGWRGAITNHGFLHKESGINYSWRPNDIFTKGFPRNLRRNIDRFNELKRLSEASGFELLETEWLGSNKKHRFIHQESGVEYEGVPGSLLARGFPVVDGQRFVTQEVCRQAFVHIFGGEFRTNRDRLKTIHGKSMELDGYEKFPILPKAFQDVGSYSKGDGAEVAFEFQGHRNHRHQKETVERDELKSKYCKDEGILLVQVEPPPENSALRNEFWMRIRDSEFMYAYICKSIQKLIGVDEKINLPLNFKINLSNWNPDRESLLNLKKFSEGNGFKLKEQNWLGAKNKHCFIHKLTGKEFEWMPEQVLRNGFPKDLRTDLDKLNKLKKFATDNGFELLEVHWFGALKNHRFIHKASGIEYKGTPASLLSRGFPKELRTTAGKFNDLKILAMNNGFELLEASWMGVRNIHRFLHKGSSIVHYWTPGHIASRGFPTELRQNIDYLNELKKISEEYGFELQEVEWMGAKNRYHFRHMQSGAMYERTQDAVLRSGFPKRFSTPINSVSTPQEKLATARARAAELATQMGPYPYGDDDEPDPTPRHRDRQAG